MKCASSGSKWEPILGYSRAVRTGNVIAVTGCVGVNADGTYTPSVVHPSNYRVEGFVEGTSVAELATLGVPVVADIGSGLIDANCPWLGGPPPAWLAGEPAARQTLDDGAALVTFSGDKLLGGPQAGIIAGDAELVRACAAHPLARALRPGAHVLLAAAGAWRSPTSTAGRARPRSRSGRWSPTPSTTWRTRAATIVAAAGVGEVGRPARPSPAPAARPAPPSPRSASAFPATTSPRCGRARPPVVARTRDGPTVLDLRTVRPGRRRAPSRRGAAHMRVVATAGHVDHGKSSLVQALTGTNPDRLEEERRRGLTIDLGFAHTTLPNGDGISFVDVPGHVRFLRNMLAGVGGVDACLFVVAATEGWKPQSEEHLRILELVGLRPRRGRAHQGRRGRRRVARHCRSWTSRDPLAGTFLADAPIVRRQRDHRRRARRASATRSTALRRTARRRRPTAAGRGCGSTGCSPPRAAAPSSPARSPAARCSADDQVHAGGRPVRVRAIQSHGDAPRPHRARAIAWR